MTRTEAILDAVARSLRREERRIFIDGESGLTGMSIVVKLGVNGRPFKVLIRPDLDDEVRSLPGSVA